MLLKIYLLVLIYFIPGISCGFLNSNTYGTYKAGRTGRFFGLFNIVSFRDDECNSTTQGVRGRALGIYRILIKITQKQWIKDEYILNIGSVLILFVLLTVYRLDLF